MHLHSVVEAARERPEAVLGRVPVSGRTEVVRVDLGARLVGHLEAEPRSQGTVRVKRPGESA